MRYLRQFALNLIIYLICEAITLFTGLSIPGNIYGMVILLILLSTGIFKEKNVREISDFFLDNLAFFFVVPAINLLSSFGLLAGSVWQSLVMILAVTVVTMASAGLVAQFLLRLKEDRRK